MADPIEHRNPVEILGEEFLDRHRQGESPSIDEYVAANPELAEDIRQLFPTMLAMERFKTNRLSSSGSRIDLQVEMLEQLGDFRIIREIGRGGMGVVYEAEQQSLRRKVALKVFPRQALRDSDQLKRFHREARTAASLHHTNIVPVFGVGEQDGLHYYVMQRIEGISLDQLVGAAQLTEISVVKVNDTVRTSSDAATEDSNIFALVDVAAARLTSRSIREQDKVPASVADERFNQRPPVNVEYRGIASIGIQVAEALDYAHAQDVLHRDIKPGNLILDPNGTVWVTDFGLATVLAPTELSIDDEIAGTLRFMAPEQFRNVQDARSDIYSLGLTLYELLTHQPAFGKTTRANTIRQILKGDVTSPRDISPKIPRDLEAIVLKAMARNSNDRYETAGQLAADLRRFTEGRSVHARRTSVAERTWRWARRNRVVAGLVTALLVLAVSSFVLVSTKWREAVAGNQRAEDNLSLALESMDQILERFASNWMAHPIAVEGDDGQLTSAGVEFQSVSNYSAEVQLKALTFYDRFAKQNPTNPQLKHDTARVHRRVADIYKRLGQYSKAETAYRRSIALFDSAELTDNPGVALEKANTLSQLGRTLHAVSRFSKAEVEFRRATAILGESSYRNNPEFAAELARTFTDLGQTLWLSNRQREAGTCHQKAVKLLEAIVNNHPGETQYRLDLAHTYRVYYQFAPFGRRPGGRTRSDIRTAGLAILERLVQDYPKVPDYRCELIEMLATTTNRPFGNSDEQTGLLIRAVELARDLSDTHPTIPRYRTALASALISLAKAQRKTDRDKADEYFAEAIVHYRQLTDDFAVTPVYRILLAMALQDRAGSLRFRGDFAGSRDAVNEGIQQIESCIELRPENPFAKGILSRLQRDLAWLNQRHSSPGESKDESPEA